MGEGDDVIPIPFPLPRRILPPTVAYAAGLVCEHRPDLADGVRAAVLGDDAVYGLDALALACAQRQDEQGALVCSRLQEIVHYGGNAATALHSLADGLGMVPQWFEGMLVRSPDGVYDRTRGPTIGDEWRVPVPMSTGRVLSGPSVCGLPDPDPVEWDREARWNAWGHEAVAVLLEYLRDGFTAIDRRAMFPTERKAFVMIVRIHAHTISLDPAECAAWAKTYGVTPA